MLATGTLLGNRYTIVGILSGSRRSPIYTAKDEQTDKLCTLKVLEVANDMAYKRFHREASIIGKLDHPGISHLLDCYLKPGQLSYIVTEYVSGQDLETYLISEGPQPPQWAVPVFLQICEALSAAHNAKVVHRNLKPSKVLLIGNPASPRVKLLDFGLAKPFEFEGDQLADLTEAGVAVGTLIYLSPEQCKGKDADARSDIYGLGCLMYRVFTGKNPFEAKSLPELVRLHAEKPPAKISKANPGMKLPDELEAIVFKCLDRNPDKRFQSMYEVKKALAGDTGARPTSILDKLKFWR